MQIEVNPGPFLFLLTCLIFLLGMIYLISHPVFLVVVFILFIGYLIIWKAPDRGQT